MSSLIPTLERFFREVAPLDPGDRLVVAFSGGPDSTSLLHALVPFVASHDCELLAVHLDHGCDPGSAQRAGAAADLARRLGAAFLSERSEVARKRGESPEAALRRIRYQFLEGVADSWGARFIATGHTRDDQAETVVLRLLAGSGIDGLAAIAPLRGRLVRPLLELDRATVHAALPTALQPLSDPGNEDLTVPRVAVRQRLLPRLDAADPGLSAALARLAARARVARSSLDRRLLERLEVRAEESVVTFSAPAFLALPAALRTAALAGLARRAGLAHPLSRAARVELLRQLVPDAGHENTFDPGEGRIGCDGAGGLRIEGAAGGRLRFGVGRARVEREAGSFTYTLALPGSVEIAELAATVTIRQAPVAAWMFQGEPTRAALALPLAPGSTVTVRSRRPGDRLRPLGAPGERKLKDVLIDHRVPRERRDWLPLVVVGERIAWVPGVTIDESCRITPGSSSAWVVEVFQQ